MNERSSRSHSVFTLRITGVNVGCGTAATEGTGEKCEGCLNLVDLAGSERLNVSFNGNAPIEKDRVRETQNINKSLSALGDVIAALGERGTQGNEGKHIPYRNSKVRLLFILMSVIDSFIAYLSSPKLFERELKNTGVFSACIYQTPNSRLADVPQPVPVGSPPPGIPYFTEVCYQGTCLAPVTLFRHTHVSPGQQHDD